MNINATLIGQMLAFLVFVWFCMKFVWPPIINAMREREKKISEGLDAASKAELDLELAKEKAAATLKESKQQAASLIDQANKRAAQIVDEAKENARKEGDRILIAARAEVDQEINRAKEALRAQLAELALAGAEKILEKSIDANTHSELLDKLATELH